MRDNSPQRNENKSRKPDNDTKGYNPEARSADLTDSPRDQDRLAPEETTIELPDVKDSPGQEFVHVPPLGELADTTISSADEEGEGLFVDDEDDETIINMGTEADISSTERRILRAANERMPTEDEERLTRATLDNTDNEGDQLNEKIKRTGSDLDIPGSEYDDRNEAIGEEDEENNSYSLGSDSNDNVTEGTP